MRLVREQALLLGDFVKATRARHTKRDTKATGGPLPFARAFAWFSTGNEELQPVAKLLRHSHDEMTFLASNRSWSQVCEIQNWPPSSLPFKVVPPSFEHGLVLLAILIRGGGGSQAQDHGQAIYAKRRYSVSSTFATGCCSQATMRPTALLWNRNTYITCKI